MFERSVAAACTVPRLRTKTGAFPLREEALSVWVCAAQARQPPQEGALLREDFSFVRRSLANANTLQAKSHGLREHRGSFAPPCAERNEGCGDKQKRQRCDCRSFYHARFSLAGDKGVAAGSDTAPIGSIRT